MNDKITQKEALDFLGMTQPTFLRYARRLGIVGEHVGRCTYYRKEDIKRLDDAMANRVPILIAKIEQLTGRKVKLI